MHIADWREIYPDIYKSYMSGAANFKSKDNLSHSHAILRQVSERSAGLWTGTNGRMGCLACKTADLIPLYEQYGDDFWAMDYMELRDDITDFWGCNLCHLEDPENTLTAASPSFKLLAGEYFDTLAPADAACGQCHSILGGYTRRLVNIPGQSLESLDPYRYGVGADGLMRAFTEDGDKLPTTKDGVEYFYAGHADVEMFQGTTHQSLGLTCASCHMPKVKNEAGKEFTSHDASGSPLANEAAMSYCLTCHKGQGIETTEAMVEFVKGKQGDLNTMHKAVQAKLDELHGLIVAGKVSEEVDKQARELYIKARWYQGYSNGDANVPGTKAPHAYALMVDYYKQADLAASEGIALFK